MYNKVLQIFAQSSLSLIFLSVSNKKKSLGSDDPEEVAYYNKIIKEMDNMKQDSIKKGVPQFWDTSDRMNK